MRRIRASGLLESVLALALLSGVLSTAVAIHFRVRAADRAMARLIAWDLTERVVALREADLGPVDHRTDGYTVSWTAVPVDAHHEHVRIQVDHAGRRLLTRDVIVERP